MSQKPNPNIDSLKASLGDLLVGAIGEPIHGLANLRAEYTALQSKADAELASTVELRAGDTDVSRHKKIVKEKEADLRSAGGRLEAAVLKLGEEVCVAHGKGELPVLIGLEEAIAARAALSSLRSDYANLEPKPNAGLLAKGKAAAQRLVVSGKIVLQETKTNDLQKTLVQSAFDRGHADQLSCPHTAGFLDKVRQAYSHVESRKTALDTAKANLAEVETRCHEIQQSDTRVASIRQKANTIKRDIVEKFCEIMDASECEEVAERLSSAYLELQAAEAEAAAAAERLRPSSEKIKRELLTDKTEMRTAQEMYDYCLSHGFGTRNKNELQYFAIIEKHLQTDEVAYVAMAPSSISRDGKSVLYGGVAVVFTSKHLIYAKKTRFGNEPVQMTRLDLVTNIVKDTKHLLIGRICIATVNETLWFDYPKRLHDAAFTAVSAALERYRKDKSVDSMPTPSAPAVAAPAVAAPTIAEQLKQFKELLDLGIITEDEFQAKKKQLLGAV